MNPFVVSEVRSGPRRHRSTTLRGLGQVRDRWRSPSKRAQSTWGLSVSSERLEVLLGRGGARVATSPEPPCIHPTSWVTRAWWFLGCRFDSLGLWPQPKPDKVLVCALIDPPTSPAQTKFCDAAEKWGDLVSALSDATGLGGGASLWLNWP